MCFLAMAGRGGREAGAGSPEAVLLRSPARGRLSSYRPVSGKLVAASPVALRSAAAPDARSRSARSGMPRRMFWASSSMSR